MWRLLAFSGLILALCSTSARAQGSHAFGLGIVLGDPTGITMKYVRSSETAFDAAVSFGGSDNFYLHATWLWLKPKVFDLDKYPVNWYLGVGPRLINRDRHHRHDHDDDDHHDDTHFAARAPFGLRMNFQDPRIEIFGEVSVSLEIVPETDVDLGLGVGARYYF